MMVLPVTSRLEYCNSVRIHLLPTLSSPSQPLRGVTLECVPDGNCGTMGTQGHVNVCEGGVDKPSRGSWSLATPSMTLCYAEVSSELETSRTLCKATFPCTLKVAPQPQDPTPNTYSHLNIWVGLEDHYASFYMQSKLTACKNYSFLYGGIIFNHKRLHQWWNSSEKGSATQWELGQWLQAEWLSNTVMQPGFPLPIFPLWWNPMGKIVFLPAKK